jgi:hypothetical protein
MARPVQHRQRDVRRTGQALQCVINHTQAGVDLALAPRRSAASPCPSVRSLQWSLVQDPSVRPMAPGHGVDPSILPNRRPRRVGAIISQAVLEFSRYLIVPIG